MIPPTSHPRADMAQIDDDTPPQAGAWIAAAELADAHAALVAAAYEAAAKKAAAKKVEYREPVQAAKILAMTPADALAELDRIKTEAEYVGNAINRKAWDALGFHPNHGGRN